MKKMRNIFNHKYFNELYCAFIFVLGFIFWTTNSTIGMIVSIAIAGVMLFLANDFKYLIPCTFTLLFCNNEGFEIGSFPLPIIICGFILVFALFAFFIKNGFHIKKIKHCYGFIALIIPCIMPVLWHNIVTKGSEVMYFLLLAYVLYTFAYVVFGSSFKEDSFDMAIDSFCYLGLMLACECIFKVWFLHKADPDASILGFWYYLGWGLCNEAGIMMCFSLPFVFIKIMRAIKTKRLIYQYVIVGVYSLGMMVTGSRATFAFGMLEMLAMMIYVLVKHQNRKVNFNIMLVLGIFALLNISHFFTLAGFVGQIKEGIFEHGFGLTGRDEIWNKGFVAWKQNPLTILFGNSLNSELDIRDGYLESDAVVNLVYHSTFVETLACFGILGIIIVAFQFAERYYQITKLEKDVFWLMLIGYVVVDVYGMIDNTYHMYYYMLPLVILMASIDASFFIDKSGFGQKVYYYLNNKIHKLKNKNEEVSSELDNSI